MRGVNARTDKARHLLRPTPGQLGMAIDLDCTVARLQLEELELRSQALADGGLALQLLLQEQLGTDSAPQTDDILQSLLDASEEQQLQEQITSLSQFIAVAEGQQTALDSVAEEEAQQAASLQLATALQAQEEWDATVLRPHDAALARAIADCSTDWEELGQGLQNPLDLTGRPTEPQDPGTLGDLDHVGLCRRYARNAVVLLCQALATVFCLAYRAWGRWRGVLVGRYGAAYGACVDG